MYIDFDIPHSFHFLIYTLRGSIIINLFLLIIILTLFRWEAQKIFSYKEYLVSVCLWGERKSLFISVHGMAKKKSRCLKLLFFIFFVFILSVQVC